MRPFIQWLLLLALAVSLIAGCSSAAPAAAPTPTLTARERSLIPDGWQTPVRTLCVQVERSYSLPPSSSANTVPSQPVTAGLSALLVSAGFTVAAPGEACDATLSIQMTGKAEAVNYGSAACYNSATYRGQATLAAPGRPTLNASLSGGNPVPQILADYDCVRDPAKAPFDRAWPPAILNALLPFWGMQAPVYALGTGSAYPALYDSAREFLEAQGAGAIADLAHGLDGSNAMVQEQCAVLLADLNSPASHTRLGEYWPRLNSESRRLAVPALIRLLNHEQAALRQAALTALKSITGQDYGSDAAHWQAWWEVDQRATP